MAGEGIKNRVKQTCTGTGTNDLSIQSGTAAVGHLKVSGAFAPGDVGVFVLESGDDYEIFYGTLSLDILTLSRNTVIESTNGGSKIVLDPVQTHIVSSVLPEQLAPYLDAASKFAKQSIRNGIMEAVQCTNTAGLPFSPVANQIVIKLGSVTENDGGGGVFYWDGAAWQKLVISNNIAASDITYDNATSSLTATNAQAAIDELDGRLDNVENITGSGTPSGFITPDYRGQVYTDTTNNVHYIAYALTNTSWKLVTSEMTANGLAARTSIGAFAARTLTGPAAGISVTNGDGVAGNPTIALSNDLSALEGLATTGIPARSGTDTWVLRTITGPGAGLSITNGDGVAGNPTFALSNDLLAVEGLTSSGIAVRTAADTWAVRTLTAPAAGISIANSSGAGGNPTFSLSNDLAGLEGLASTGIPVRTATDTWTQRTIIGPAAGVTVSNGDGIAGNPTIALGNDLSALEGLGSTGYAVRTAADTWAQRTITGGGGITVTNGNGVAGNTDVSITDAELLAVASVTSVADRLLRFTGSGTADLIRFEEGTWTPVLSAATPGTLSVTYAANGQVGRYIRIGNYVLCFFVISTTSVTIGTASGGIRFTGLPFTSANITGMSSYVGSLGYVNQLTYTGTYLGLRVPGNTSYFVINQSTSAGTTSVLTIGNVGTADFEIIGTILFETT